MDIEILDSGIVENTIFKSFIAAERLHTAYLFYPPLTIRYCNSYCVKPESPVDETTGLFLFRCMAGKKQTMLNLLLAGMRVKDAA